VTEGMISGKQTKRVWCIFVDDVKMRENTQHDGLVKTSQSIYILHMFE